MLGQIDYTLKPQELELFLAKPNKTIIAKLTEAFDKKQQFKLGGINEITFSLPLVVENANHELVRNSNVDMAKSRYLVKAQLGQLSEWYRIEKINDDGADTEKKTYQLYSLGIELTDKIISGYEETSINAQTALIDALSSTIWNIDYIGPEFLSRFRYFEVSQKSALDFVFQIAETFNALPIFNTNNRTVSLYQPENIGSDKGLKIAYGKYLKSINKEEDASKVVTRLKVYGADGLSIQKVNPSGTTWVEDYSYFMHPFERDGQGNVIKSSEYMSDGLCVALINYNALLESKKTDFSTLLGQKTALQTTLTTRQNEMTTLQTQLAIILDNLDIAQTTNQPTDAIITQRNNKQSEISVKQGEINTLKSQIDVVDASIATLRSQISMQNNFTPQQIMELNQYIVEREWVDENYIDDVELYNAAREMLSEINSPQIAIRIDIVNFKEIVEEQYNWDKLNLGDTIYIYHERFKINVKAKILEMSFDYGTANVDLLISNVVNVTDDDDIKFKDLLRRLGSTSTVVNMNKFKWNGVENVENDVNKLLNETWDAAKRAINSGVNNTVTIDRRGITITSSDDPLKGIRMVNSTIGLSGDGFNTFETAITSSGIIAERLMGRIIIANNLHIENDAGMFRFDKDGATLKDADLTITHKTAPSRIIMNANDGIRIQKNNGGTWQNQLSIDAGGNIILSGGSITWGAGGITPPTATQVGARPADWLPTAAQIGALPASTTVYTQQQIEAFSTNITNTTVTTAFVNALNVTANSVNSNWVYAGQISAGQITAGLINANQINAQSLYVPRLQNWSGHPNNYATVGGVYSDLSLYHNNNIFFQISNALDAVNIWTRYGLVLSKDSIATKPQGVWDFTGVTVTGLTAVARFA